MYGTMYAHHLKKERNTSLQKQSQETDMAEQDRKLEHGLQVMLDILTGYFANNATRTE